MDVSLDQRTLFFPGGLEPLFELSDVSMVLVRQMNEIRALIETFQPFKIFPFLQEAPPWARSSRPC
jgi:hypothetical protein